MASVRTISVIGAGRIGRGIAQATALAGYPTLLHDILPAALRRAQDEFRANLEAEVLPSGVSAAEAEAILARTEYASDLDRAARAADMVIEAVPEEMDSKVEIFTLLDRTCRPTTILVSTACLLSLTEISSITCQTSKIVGMRFRHPVREMKLLEVVRVPGTEDETVAAAVEVARRMGKEVSIVSEGDGLLRT